MPMVRYIHDPANPAKATPEEEEARRTMTDEEIEAAALADPDAQPLTDAQIERATLARELTVIRKQTGLTQAEFAAAIGAPIGTVRNWEQGRSMPGPVERRVFQAIARDPAGALAVLRVAAE